MSTCGECLFGLWGVGAGCAADIVPKDYRYRAKSFLGTKWNDVFIEAEVSAENELSILKDALDARERALIDAE